MMILKIRMRGMVAELSIHFCFVQTCTAVSSLFLNEDIYFMCTKYCAFVCTFPNNLNVSNGFCACSLLYVYTLKLSKYVTSVQSIIKMHPGRINLELCEPDRIPK